MITINAPELARFKAAANRVDKRIIPRLRKGLRTIGSAAVKEIKETVTNDGGPSSEGIAAGTSLRVSFSKTGGGVKITTTNARLSAEHKGFVAAFNKPSFRHPVYGNKQAWVQQEGRPYFGVSIERAFDEKAQQEMAAVFREAMNAIGAR